MRPLRTLTICLIDYAHKPLDFEKSSSCLQLTPTPHSHWRQRSEVDREDKNGDETFLMVFASPSYETEGNPDKSINSLFSDSHLSASLSLHTFLQLVDLSNPISH